MLTDESALETAPSPGLASPSLAIADRLRQGPAKNPTEIPVLRKLARSCVVEGRGPEAAELYAQILRAQARDLEALNHLANFHLERSDFKQATTLLQAILAIEPGHRMARYHLNALQALLQALKERSRPPNKLTELYEKIAQADDGSVALGLKRELIPCLIEMNGDQLWMPGDLLRFLWHTVQKPHKSPVPSFLAETGHYAWVRDRLAPGAVALDLGANLGIFATMMGTKVGPSGRVFAFEPSARIASDLRRVLALNELHHVTVVEAAVSDRNGTATFCEIQEGDVRRESSHLSDPALDQALGALRQQATQVKTVVVDDFVADLHLQPALLKIDVEGAEFPVLEGARKTIAANHPKLVIEIHANGAGIFDHARLTAYLRQYGYEYKNEDKTYFCW